MTILGWSASFEFSYYARARNSAWIVVAMLFLACAPSYTRAQAPAGARVASSGRSAAELVRALRTAQRGEIPALEAELLARGPEAVKPLIELIAAGKAKDRATIIIANLGVKAVAPLAALLPDPALRSAASLALAHAVGLHTAGRAEELLACITAYSEVKHSCGIALVRGMNPKQARWTGLLAKAMKSGDRDVRLYAALSLKQIGLAVPGVREALMTVVSDPDDEVRQVVRSLGLRPAPKPAAKKGVQAK